MNIPIELWREISLLLPRHHLAVNKEFLSFYDENWYRDKILSQYPNCKKHDNSWKYLYKRSLKITKKAFFIGEFHIYFIIKIVHMSDYNQEFFLTFDGDLYCCDKYFTVKLIDINVTDIGHYTYIKEKEWYEYITDKDLIEKSEEKFIAVASDCGADYAAITDNLFYYRYDYNYHIKKIENKNNLSLTCDKGLMFVKDISGISKFFQHSSQSLIEI